jgi:hypothetical protein
LPPRRASSRGLEEEDDWIIDRQSSAGDGGSDSDDGATAASFASLARGRGSGTFSAGALTPGRTQSGSFLGPSSPCGSMGRKRLSFT